MPELGLFSVAYLFKDIPHFERVVNDPQFIKRVDEIIASKNLGIKRMGFYAAGVRNIYSRKGSVAGPEDLRGVKIRVQNNPIEVKVWKAFGAIPTPMNFGEVYQALQSGVLDAAENGLAVIESNKHYEAAKFISQTEHQRNLSALYINEKKLASMPPDLQKIVLDAAAEAATYERKKDAELVAAAAERLKSKGATLTTPRQGEVHRLDRADPGRGGERAEDGRSAAAHPHPREVTPDSAGGATLRPARALLGPVLAALLAFITIGVFIQVVLRYVFAMSFLWGEELSLFAFIWCIFLGTAICSVRHTHFSFDMFHGLRGRAAGVQRLIVDLCVLGTTIVIMVTGWQFSKLSVARLSPALGITLFVPTIVIPAERSS